MHACTYACMHEFKRACFCMFSCTHESCRILCISYTCGCMYVVCTGPPQVPHCTHKGKIETSKPWRNRCETIHLNLTKNLGFNQTPHPNLGKPPPHQSLEWESNFRPNFLGKSAKNILPNGGFFMVMNPMGSNP